MGETTQSRGPHIRHHYCPASGSRFVLHTFSTGLQSNAGKTIFRVSSRTELNWANILFSKNRTRRAPIGTRAGPGRAAAGACLNDSEGGGEGTKRPLVLYSSFHTITRVAVKSMVRALSLALPVWARPQRFIVVKKGC